MKNSRYKVKLKADSYSNLEFASAPCFINLHLPAIRCKGGYGNDIEVICRAVKATVTANVFPPGTSQVSPGGTGTRPTAVTVPATRDSYRISYRSHPIHLSNRIIVGNRQGVIIKTYITVAIEVATVIPVTVTGD